MNVKGHVGPSLERLDGCAELGDIIGQVGAYEVEHFREAARGEPCGACSAMGMAIVEGRAIRPDVLPHSRYTAQAGEGDGGGWGIFLEELLIGEMIAESIWSSKKRLGGIKYASAAEGVRHGRPYTDVRAKQ